MENFLPKNRAKFVDKQCLRSLMVKYKRQRLYSTEINEDDLIDQSLYADNLN